MDTEVTSVPSRGRALIRDNRFAGSFRDPNLPYTDDIIQFLNSNRPRLSNATIRHYDHITRYASKDLRDMGRSDNPRTVTPEDIRRLLAVWDARGITTATQRTYIQSFSSYLRYYDNDAVRKARLYWSKPATRNVDWLTGEQLNRLTNSITDPMIRCACILMSYGCLRRVECIRLRVQDIDLVRKTIKVHGKGHKGGKLRTIPMTPVIETAIRRYLDKRGRQVHDWLVRHPDEFQPSHLFLANDIAKDTLKGFSETGTGWDKHVLYPMQRFVNNVLHTTLGNHTLRRTCARLYWQSGMTVEEVGALLGHQSTEVTLLYLGINVDDVSDAMGRAMADMTEKYGKAYQ